VAVDDCWRLAYLEIHPDERSQAAVGFTGRALAWFAGLGITVERVMTDNGACYRCDAFGRLLASAGIAHQRTRPYRPCTNGKVERFNQTLDREWAYAAVSTSNQARLAALPSWLHTYNCHRPHTALNKRNPMNLLNNVPGNHT
jgi:transposase InsO family protein